MVDTMTDCLPSTINPFWVFTKSSPGEWHLIMNMSHPGGGGASVNDGTVHWWSLGMEWNSKHFVDTALLFGLCTAPKTFNTIADALQWAVLSRGT